MMRVIDLPDGHMLIYGSATLCQKSMVDLVCNIKGIQTLTLTYCDISGDRWRKKLRSVTKKSGVEGKRCDLLLLHPLLVSKSLHSLPYRCCLRVSLDILKASPEVRSCLSSIIDLGTLD